MFVHSKLLFLTFEQTVSPLPCLGPDCYVEIFEIVYSIGRLW